MKAGRIKDLGISDNIKGCGNCGAWTDFCQRRLKMIGKERCWYPIGALPAAEEKEVMRCSLKLKTIFMTMLSGRFGRRRGNVQPDGTESKTSGIT